MRVVSDMLKRSPKFYLWKRLWLLARSEVQDVCRAAIRDDELAGRETDMEVTDTREDRW